MRKAKELAICGGRLAGDAEDDMLGRTDRRERRTRRSRTAKAAHRNRLAMKYCCARESRGWGRKRVNGLGQHNPNRSEGPCSVRINPGKGEEM
jgi:hypothetical protein